MSDAFDPLKDFYAVRDARARIRRLPAIKVTLETSIPTFVYPNPNYIARIQNSDGLLVGTARYGINPLNDRLYIYRIDVLQPHRRYGYALAFLWSLHLEHSLPITPIHIVGAALGFWGSARQFQSLGFVLTQDLRFSEQDDEQARWAHLAPEPAHLAQQRAVEASPEWPAIKAAWAARKAS